MKEKKNNLISFVNHKERRINSFQPEKPFPFIVLKMRFCTHKNVRIIINGCQKIVRKKRCSLFMIVEIKTL